MQEIHDLLNNPAYDVRQSLQIQKEAIDRHILQLQNVSYALAHTLEKLESAGNIEWEQVMAIIQGLSAADKAEWLARYYPPELAHWMHERAVQASPELIQAGVRAWQKLYAAFRQHSHLPPDDPQVQALAAQMHRLITLFTGGNPAIEDGLRAMYSDPAALPDIYRFEKADSVLQQFMQTALTIYREQRDPQ